MSDVWFVTGCARGLGRAVVEQAVASGHYVVATARNTDGLSEFGDRVYSRALDVTDAGQVNDCINAGIERFGSIDVVVNNAAYASFAPIEDMSHDEFRKQLEITFFGAVNVTKAVLPHFRQRRSGRFFQISSIAGRWHHKAGTSAYHSAKGALENFSGCLAEEVKSLGIHVTIVEPSAMRSDFTKRRKLPEFHDDYSSAVWNVADRFFERSGTEKVDPQRVAQALVELSTHPEPPLRLLMGSEAVRYADSLASRQAEEDQRWADLSFSVDFPT